MRDLEIRGAGNLLGAAQSGLHRVGRVRYVLRAAGRSDRRSGAACPPRSRSGAKPSSTSRSTRSFPTTTSRRSRKRSPSTSSWRRRARKARSRRSRPACATASDRSPNRSSNLVELTKLRAIALRKHVTRVVVDEHRLTLGVGSGFALDPAALPEFQSLTKNRFRFGEGRILVDLPERRSAGCPCCEGFSRRSE